MCYMCALTCFLPLQVAHCYTQQLSTLPRDLSELLMNHHTVVEPDLRMVRRLNTAAAASHQLFIERRVHLWGFSCFWQTLCKALILLRNKNLIDPCGLLELFFELLRCHDKLLRKVRMLRLQRVTKTQPFSFVSMFSSLVCCADVL